jgi:hypothetical protein
MCANQRAEMVPRLSTVLASAHRFRGASDLTARIASVKNRARHASRCLSASNFRCAGPFEAAFRFKGGREIGDCSWRSYKSYQGKDAAASKSPPIYCCIFQYLRTFQLIQYDAALHCNRELGSRPLALRPDGKSVGAPSKALEFRSGIPVYCG